MNVIDEVIASSARPRVAFRWILEVQAQGMCFENFRGTTFEERYCMVTLDAKLAAALANAAPNDFQRILQARKHEALKEGAMVTGRQILFLIDQHFRMTEADGAVYDTEHLFSVTVEGDRLQEFLSTWDTVLAGLKQAPDDTILETLFLRQIRKCRSMEQDVAYYDRLTSDHVEKNYQYLLRCARKVVERSRLQWYRNELSRSIGGIGPAAHAGSPKGDGKGNKKGDNKGNKGDRKRSNPPGSGKKGGQKGGQSNSALGDQRPSPPPNHKKDICQFHLKGKCKNGESCPTLHNPPCRFVQMPGGCNKGKNCLFPHQQTAAPAAGNEKGKGNDETYTTPWQSNRSRNAAAHQTAR